MVSKDDVRYIAHLSRIHLEDEELKSLTKDLEEILGYVAKLNKLDVKDIQPTSHVLSLKNVFREDVVRPSLAQKVALQISDHQNKGFFKVPQVIE